MTPWITDELARLTAADELQIAGRNDDDTLRKSITIWMVTHDGALYVRSANGPDSGWYRGTQLRGLGHISAGGVGKDVTFTRDDSVNTELDAAYQAKYNHAPSAVASVTSATATSTTLRVDPQ